MQGEIQLEELTKAFGERRRRRRHRPRDAAGRVLHDGRPVRLRQDDDAAHDRRLRAPDERADRARRRRRRAACRRTSATSTRCSRATRCSRTSTWPSNVAFGLKYQKLDEGGAAPSGSREALELVQLGELREAQAGPALRRPAAARRARARARAAAARAAARRAARRARRPAAQGPAGRAEGAAGRARDHLRLRHARPGGGAHDERPRRRDERRPRRAGGHAARRSTRSRRRVFVADFLGVSNLLAAEAVGRDGAGCALRIGERGSAAARASSRRGAT